MFSFQKPSLFSDRKIEYTYLVQEDIEATASVDVRPNPRLRKESSSKLGRLSGFTGNVLLVFFAAWGLVSFVVFAIAKARESHIPSERFAAATWPSCSCGGETTARAKELGCLFSPLALAWLPPHCIDMELSDDFDQRGPGINGEWDYWSDYNKTRRLTREEVGELANRNGVFYATQDWHLTHCVYTWKKHYRSHWTGTVIERRSNGLDHIDHCAQVFRIRSGLQEIWTVAGVALDADDPGEVM